MYCVQWLVTGDWRHGLHLQYDVIPTAPVQLHTYLLTLLTYLHYLHTYITYLLNYLLTYSLTYLTYLLTLLYFTLLYFTLLCFALLYLNYLLYLLYLLTHSMQQSPSWEANWFCKSRNSLHFTEPESSLPHSQASATCLSWASPIQSIPPHPTSWSSV